jgi:hypothetical protein
VTKTGEVVFCIVCFLRHDEHPEIREDETRPHAQDYTYYVDAYKGNVGPICWEHDRDEISERKMAEFDKQYRNRTH